MSGLGTSNQKRQKTSTTTTTQTVQNGTQTPRADWFSERFTIDLPDPLPLPFQPGVQQKRHAAGSSPTGANKPNSSKKVTAPRMPDVECSRMAALSIKKILMQSLNEEFRQECFKLMKVTNSEDAELVIRNKFLRTIDLPEEKYASTMQQRMDASNRERFRMRQNQINQMDASLLRSQSPSLLTMSQVQLAAEPMEQRMQPSNKELLEPFLRMEDFQMDVDASLLRSRSPSPSLLADTQDQFVEEPIVPVVSQLRQISLHSHPIEPTQPTQSSQPHSRKIELLNIMKIKVAERKAAKALRKSTQNSLNSCTQ